MLILSFVTAGCGKKQAAVTSFVKESPIPVSLTLSKAEGETGRSSPISNDYRPQVWFAGASEEFTCAVKLPASATELAPGQTLDVALSCDSDIKIDAGKPEFGIFEGGKKVGDGRVRLP